MKQREFKIKEINSHYGALQDFIEGDFFQASRNYAGRTGI